MDFRMSAVLTDTDITAELFGFAVYDGTGSFFLDIALILFRLTEGIIGTAEHFLNFKM